MKKLVLTILLIIEVSIVFSKQFEITSFNNDTLHSVIEKINNEIIYPGFEALYNFQFIKADSIIDSGKKKYSDNISIHILAANYYWWMLISGEDQDNNKEKYIENLDFALHILTNKNNSPKNNAKKEARCKRSDIL